MVLLFTCLNLQLSAQSISLEAKDITVKQAIEMIQANSPYTFVYAISDLDTQRVVSLNSNNLPIEQVVDQLIAGEALSYTVKGEQVIIKKVEKVAAQPYMLTGRVIDTEGNALIGASIVIDGTTYGTSTNIDGEYSLRVTPGSTLVVAYIGHESKQITVASQKTLNVVLAAEATELNSVVVTALGIKRAEKALSYNVQEVDGEAIASNKDVNFINSLSGKVAGVVVNSSSSGVGGSSRVIMRGVKSISQTSNTLYVIDGVPIYITARDGGTEFSSQGTTDPIADLNPEDIASMSVLNGAAAAALYGSDAANGAIIINTKSGEAGVTSVTVSSSVEVMSPLVMPQFQNTYGTGDLNSELGSSTRSWGEKLNDSNYMGYDPATDYFQNGTTFTNSVAFSTGNEKNQSYFSASSVNSDGIIPNNQYNKYSFNFRNTTSFLEDRMKLNVGATYTMQDDLNMTNQGTYSNPLVGAYLFPRSGDWSDIQMFERYDVQDKVYSQYWPVGDMGMTVQNPYWINYRNLRENTRDRYALNTSLSYDVTDWLNLVGRVRVDNSTNSYQERYYGSTNTQLTEQSSYGLYGVTTSSEKQTYGDVLANISKNFGTDWSLTANLGASISDISYDAVKVRGPIRDGSISSETASLMNVFNIQNLSNTSLTERLQEGYREQTQSVFASAELGYKGAYYLSLTARNDWPSALAGEHSSRSSYFYPSVGLSALLSEIFELPSQISYLKLRGSFASVGVAFERYIANPQYSWDSSGLSWSVSTTYPVYNLLPERTHSYEAGITARFLRYFNLDFTYYHTNTMNQTFSPDISTSSGSSDFLVQAGNVENKGIELALGFDKSWGKFSWGSNYTLSMNRNKIVELGENLYNPTTGESFSIDLLDMGGLNQAHYILKEGGSMGDLYSLADVVRDSNNDIYVDKDGNIETYTISDPNDYIYLGSTLSKANMAWSNSFKYNNFNLDVMVSARIGGIVYSQTQATLDYYGVSQDTADARDQGGVLINGGDLIDANTWYSAVANGANTVPQYYVYSATNVRLQELSFGYTFPRSLLGDLCDVNLSLVGRNLFMIYCKAPFDPETSATSVNNYYQGIDYFMSPSLRNIGFSLRVKF